MIPRSDEWYAFEKQVHAAVSFRLPGTIWRDANEAMMRGEPVPFFVVPRHLLTNPRTTPLSASDMIRDLIETPRYVPSTVPGMKRKAIEIEEEEEEGPGPRTGQKKMKMKKIGEDAPGVTHQVQHWALQLDGQKLIRRDEEERWCESAEGRSRQQHLLSAFKQAATQPVDRLPLNKNSAIFIPLINSTLHVPQRALDSWVTLAQDFEVLAPRILRECNLLPPDFCRWTDIITDNILPSTLVGEGFSALRPEAFVKSTLSYTTEHMEHFGSTSVNLYPLQHLRSSASSSSSSSSSSASSSSAIPTTPTSSRFRSRNLWRGWLMADVDKAFRERVPEFKDKPRVTRRDLQNFYVDHFLDQEFEMARWFVEELKVPTFFVFQEEGDVVMTTHLGSHDVVYVGGPSYQVSWNFGFSLSAATQLLEDFHTVDKDGFTGNDASNTGFVFRRFLRTCWPGEVFFRRWYPGFFDRDVKVFILLHVFHPCVSYFTTGRKSRKEKNKRLRSCAAGWEYV